MSDYDSPWKEALQAYFKPFLAFFFPEAHAGIDWRRGCQTLDKDLQKVAREAALGPRRVDHLVKVWLLSGEERWLLIHVEVQTTRQTDFAKRMYVYNYRLFDLYNRMVISMAVLADENRLWRPDRFGYSCWGFRAGIQFPVVKLLDYADRWEALEENPNPFAVVVLAHLKTQQTRQDEKERYAWKVRLIKGLYRGRSAREVRRLFRIIDWVMDLPEPLDTDFWHQIKQYEEEKQMPFMTTPERIGREEGLTKGREEGREEGLTKGIEVALELKFGEAGLRLMPEIRTMADQAKLEAVLHAVRTAASPEDLRRMWTA